MIFKSRLDYAFSYTPKSENLLDIGCDYGTFTINYVKKAKKIYAVDPNKKVISVAKKKYKKYSNIQFIVSPAEKLPFKDNFFDTVTITDAFEHVANEKETIKEIYRVLKPNGTIIFSVPYKGMFRWLDPFNLKFYFPKLYKWWKGNSYNKDIYTEAPWHRHYSVKEINKFFKNKFEIQKIHRGGLFIVPFCWLVHDGIYCKFFKKTPKTLMKVHNLISDIDYTIPYGPLAHHITLKAVSIKK